MRTIGYNDVTALWSRSHHPVGTRLLSSSDDSDNFSGTLEEQKVVVHHWSTPVTGAV
jgi:hypothetical protein